MTPESAPKSERVPFPFRAIAIILALLAIAYFWALGHPPLIDPDEPVYGEVGKLMARSHVFADWWTPHYNGNLWFDKPPMTYWLIGLSMRLFGVSEFAARLPSAIAALVLVYVTARLAWKLYPTSQTTPIWSAIATGTCVQTLLVAHSATTDLLLVASLTAAVMWSWKWVESGRRVPILLAGSCYRDRDVVKGPVAIVLLGGQLLIYLASTRQLSKLLDAKLWISLAICLLVAAPWYVSMVHLHGQLFIQGFLESQNIGRFLSAEHPKIDFPLVFLPILILGFLPWTFALVPGAIESFKRARAGNHADTYALIWIAFVFVFFSLSASKLVTYIFPLYPFAACISGQWLAEMRERTWRRTALAASGGVLAVAFAVTASLPFWNHPNAKRLSAIEMGHQLARYSQPSDTVYVLTFTKPSLVYYSDRHLIYTDDEKRVSAALQQAPYPLCAGDQWFVMNNLVPLLHRPYKILAQSGNTVILIKCR